MSLNSCNNQIDKRVLQANKTKPDSENKNFHKTLRKNKKRK